MKLLKSKFIVRNITKLGKTFNFHPLFKSSIFIGNPLFRISTIPPKNMLPGNEIQIDNSYPKPTFIHIGLIFINFFYTNTSTMNKLFIL